MKNPFKNSGYINPETIEKVKLSADIIDVVSEYITLKDKGETMEARCPFHSEKTPSFKVSKTKGFYYCFGCHASGDAITFVMEIESVDFITAIRTLASKYLISISTEESLDLPEFTQSQELARINADTAAFYVKNVNASNISKLYDRGLSDEVIKEFKIGIAPDSWDALYTHLKKTYSVVPLELSGNIRKKDEKYYDFFRNRIVVPIEDVRNTVLGFTARDLGNTPAKYINSPDTPIYTKKHNLFGINKAKEHIIRDKFAIVTEGVFDCISLHQYGIKNAVAGLGTAFTEHQAKLLNRFTSNVVLCYDGDDAGRESAIKTGKILLQKGMTIKVMVLPDGDDPDDYIRKVGAKKFTEHRAVSSPFMIHVVDWMKRKYAFSIPAEKSKAIEETLSIIALIDDAVQRREYFELICKSYSIHESIQADLWKSLESGEIQIDENILIETKLAKFTEIERIICKLGLNSSIPSSISDRCKQLENLQFIEALSKSDDKREFLESLSDESLKTSLYAIYLESNNVPVADEEECVKHLDILILHKKLNSVIDNIKDTNDETKLESYLKEQQDYIKQIQTLTLS